MDALAEYNKRNMTTEQRNKVQSLSDGYHVAPAWADWQFALFDLPAGYIAGWVGGNACAGKTIYVGIAPDGRASS